MKAKSENVGPRDIMKQGKEKTQSQESKRVKPEQPIHTRTPGIHEETLLDLEKRNPEEKNPRYFSPLPKQE